MQSCSKCKEFECSCSAKERVRIGPVMGVVVTVPDSIGSAVKHDYVGGDIWSGN
jgi:hypothetical protein